MATIKWIGVSTFLCLFLVEFQVVLMTFGLTEPVSESMVFGSRTHVSLIFENREMFI